MSTIEINTETLKNPYSGGFMNGMKQLRVCDTKAATKDLWEALNINNRISFSFYRKGANDIKLSQILKVEAVFAKYGITENIWGSI